MPKTPQGDGNDFSLITSLAVSITLSCLKPRKGTETSYLGKISGALDVVGLSCLKPRKGTETILGCTPSDCLLLKLSCLKPRKGTETNSQRCGLVVGFHIPFMPKTPQGDGNSWHKLKTTISSFLILSCLKPRKGTETLQ
jgi:hypothetical protein